ncbi:MAG: translation initiation factor IF-2 subunit gamma [Candidatus Diapherotrites archaeon]|nr:translation initiation factor IF-2 subunit gamma [Candidatus Diapherotrites archaeon]
MAGKKVKTDSSAQCVQAEVNIGLAGHVDAGKTTLTQALSGKWTDTHSEELKRGISIRLGYADIGIYKCSKCKEFNYSNTSECPQCKSPGILDRKVSFVDAPGHETLMTTMLSGAALMQGALLVIAANETCPQAQTIEHLNALIISGIEQVIVVQSKVDLVTEERALESHKEIKEFLKDTQYKNAPIVPIAAHFKINIDILLEEIQKSISSPKFDSTKPLKMFCARSFDINKPGTLPSELHGSVLGGTIIQGTIKKGDTIELTPWLDGKQIQTKVIEIRTSDGVLEEAKPGGLIAIETLLDPSLAQNDQLKGQNIGAVGIFSEPTTVLKIEMHFLDRVVVSSAKRVVQGDDLVLTVGTATLLGIVSSVKGNTVVVALKKPAVAEKEQKLAVSKRDQMKWRLIAYAINK